MALLLAEKPTPTLPRPDADGHEELSPVHLLMDLDPSEFDRLAEYAWTVGGMAADTCGQMVLTQFLAATDKLSFMSAAQQAARDARAAGFIVTGFDYDLVNVGDIAARVNRSRQAICQYVDSSRGPGRFPIPFGHAGRSKIWDWGTVNTWFRTFDGSGDRCYLPPRIVLERLNSWLHQGNTP